ncbi:MAG: hypothetical protein AABY26_04460, partial [Nanoarchaeota archaeon]
VLGGLIAEESKKILMGQYNNKHFSLGSALILPARRGGLLHTYAHGNLSDMQNTYVRRPKNI